jgi:ribosomal protein L16 Arg81 hydroxylase
MLYFADLIRPINDADFLANYWEISPLLVTGRAANYYDEIISLNDVDSLLSRKNLRHPTVRLVKDSLELSPTRFVRHASYGGIDDFIDSDKLFHEFYNGATIIVDYQERNLVPIEKLCRAMEDFFDFSAHANLYLTPRQSRGFSAHYDTHSVFILQIFGTKTWKIYDAPVSLPTRKLPFQNIHWEPTDPILEVSLRPGDLLYMPRGFIHEGVTSSDISLHLTLGILAPTWIDLFKVILAEKLDNISELRPSLPVRFFKNGLDDLNVDQMIGVLLKELPSQLNAKEFIRTATLLSLVKETTDDRFRLRDYIEAGNLHQQTLLLRKRKIRFQLEEEDDESVVLYFYNKRLRFPADLTKAIIYITKHDHLRPNDLPDSLSDESKLVLCKRLVKEGFLTIDKNAGEIDNEKE